MLSAVLADTGEVLISVASVGAHCIASSGGTTSKTMSLPQDVAIGQVMDTFTVQVGSLQ